MPFQKLEQFTKKVSDLSDKPTLSPSEMKNAFDAAPNEVREYLNQLIDALISVSNGDSGAKNIGASTISGVNGNDVQSMLENLKTQLDQVSIGEIENTSLTANPALAPTGNTGSIEQLISWLANRIKAITGKNNWFDTPANTIESLANTAVKGAGEKILTGSVIPTTSTNVANVTFPSAFSSPPVILVTLRGSAGQFKNHYVVSETSTGFSIVWDTNFTSTSGVKFWWVAIGG